MALGWDAAGPSASGTNGTTSPLTWSHTVTGSNNTLLVGVACDNDATTITSVTYGAAPMTGLYAGSANYKHSNGGTAGWVAVYRLWNASAGTATVTVTLSGNATAEGGSLSFSGSDPAAGTGTPQSAVGSSSPTLSFTPTTSGNIVAAFLVNGAFITSATSPLTSRFINNGGGSNAGGHLAGATAPSTGSAVTTAWTADADWWAIIAVEVLAGGAGTLQPAGYATAAGDASGAAVVSTDVLSGPAYATAAADLGGGSGAWSTPDYAAGGP